jgi:hypothetical protein
MGDSGRWAGERAGGRGREIEEERREEERKLGLYTIPFLKRGVRGLGWIACIVFYCVRLFSCCYGLGWDVMGWY